MRYNARSRYGARPVPRDLMLVPPSYRGREYSDAEEAAHERQQERDGGGPCRHDGTATGALHGTRGGRLTPTVRCEDCGAVLQTLEGIDHTVNPALDDDESKAA